MRRPSWLRCQQASARRAQAVDASNNSVRTGTAISAAAVGVGARTSAAKSISVTSVSWPTAEISGIMLSAAARTTISSLNDHRSSIEPPPRATIIRSGRGIGPPAGSALKPWIAAATSAAEPSPCTRTGHTSTRRGKRSARRCRMSRITAPVGEVTTPITSRQKRQQLLARRVEQPFGGELLLALLEQRHQRADAGRLQRLDDDLVFRPARIGGEPAGGDHFEPFLGLEAHAAEGALPDHRLDLGAFVLEREIAVAGGMRAAIAGNLAAHPHIAVGVLDRAC